MTQFPTAPGRGEIITIGTADIIERLVEVPIILILELEHAVSTLSEKKAKVQTVTSRRAHPGTLVPVGTGLGNL